MLEFFDKNNINRSKKLLQNNFNQAINNRINSQKDPNFLKITSYNVHYLMPPPLSQSAISFKEIMSNLKKLIGFCQKSKSDLILLQEALFNDTILKHFQDNQLVPYVCETYALMNTNENHYKYGNIVLINNPEIKSISPPKKISISGFQHRNKCLLNLVIKYHNILISIYNVHLDVWDRTGKCRLEQINKILEIVKNDKFSNIIIAGDFNAIKKEDYSKSQKKALKNFYNIYTKNPFKEIQYLIQKGFTDVASMFSDKITSTVWSKQRVDFFFIKDGFSIPILDYKVNHISGSDHYPISILLLENCLDSVILNQPTKEKIDIISPKKVEPFLYRGEMKNGCPIYMKIIPIWKKNWKNIPYILKYFSEGIVKYGQDYAFNEYFITRMMSLLVENNVTYGIVKTIGATETKKIMVKVPLEIPNQKYYILIQPEYGIEKMDLKYTDLIIFQLQWTIYITHKLFKFIHGDILNGRDHNVFFHNFNFHSKKMAIFHFGKKIWKFPIDGILPTIIQFDFGFSDFQYKNIKIHNKIPFHSTDEFPIGSKKTIEKKMELDNEGYNLILKKIGIKHRIPMEIDKLLNGFDKYIINTRELKELNKSEYLFFNGNLEF